jgi:FdhD protein
MTQKQKTVTGVILAGGLARRMGGQDKGLIQYKQRPMISYAIHAISPLVDQLVINANRNLGRYQQWGFPVIADRSSSFDGPLAGILSVMKCMKYDVLLVMPCDSPLIDTKHLQKLVQTLSSTQADICVAYDGERLHPVFLAMNFGLERSLEKFLASGQRKIDVWLAEHKMVQADFSDESQIFLNINTMDELSELETLPDPCGKPQMSDAGLSSAKTTIAVDEKGQTRSIELVGERALTLYVDKQEIVTLMTIGTHPELLTLGYLRNQGFIESLADIKVIQVDWETEAVAVVTHKTKSATDFSAQLAKRTVTTGCGQGTVFGRLMDKLKKIRVPNTQIKQPTIYALLDSLHEHNKVYKRAGAVHGCALCSGSNIDFFVEDVGRHNAVDVIAGYMWLNGITGEDKIFYTTGRLTSEMVIKVTQMGIPVLLSRSGATQMGLDMAKQAGVTLISRAKGKHFLVLNGVENVEFDNQ